MGNPNVTTEYKSKTEENCVKDMVDTSERSLARAPRLSVLMSGVRGRLMN